MRRFSGLLFALLLILAAPLLRWRAFERPISNLDEASTFTMAQQVLAGDVLYRDAADNRSPLLPYLKAAVFAVAGDWNTYAVHVLLAVLMGCCALMLWRICRHLGDNVAGVAGAVVFTVLSFAMLDAGDAISANTGWFLVVFSTTGFWLFARSLTRPTFWRGALCGLCFGASFLCKQPGLFDLFTAWVLMALLAVQFPAQRRTWLTFALGSAVGAALPVIGFVVYFAANRALADLVYYAYTFNTQLYIPEVPRLERLAGMAMPFQLAWHHSPAAFVLGITGAVAALVAVVNAVRRRPITFPLLPWLVLGWTAAGILSTGLSGRTFSHYSAQVVPGLSLACGWMIARVVSWANARAAQRGARYPQWIASAVLIAVLALFVRDCLPRFAEFRPSHSFERDVGRIVAAHTTKEDRIFVWGYLPEIYFFAHRLPASRFIYTNYVTGMIAWTNLDPLKDTTYAIAPNAWAQLTGDLARRPPAVIVDTAGARGYLKFPLHDQAPLWDLIKRDFAQVAVNNVALRDCRIFRRLETASGANLPKGIAEDSSVVIAGYHTLHHHEPVRVRVTAPAGATRVELYAGGRLISVLNHPISQPVDVLFFADSANAAARDLRAVVTTSRGPLMSRSLNFFEYAGRIAATPLVGPHFNLANLSLPPIAQDRAYGEIMPSPQLPDTWRLDAPETLEYRCPAGLSWISFVHGPYASTQGRSDGYDLQVILQEDSGKQTIVHQKRLHPRGFTLAGPTIPADQVAQNVSLRLPSHGDGRLIFRFLAGDQNNSDYDWIYFGQLRGNADGPMLLMGDQPVLPTNGVTGGKEPMKQLLSGNWMAHAPARLEWERPANLSALTLTYGLEEGAYTAANGHSDGIELTLVLIDRAGTTHPIFKRDLTPFNHPEHRGPQASRVEIPAGLEGRLVLTIGPGPRDDASWDWAWLGPIACEGPGPNIELPGDRRLMPVSSRVVDANGGPSKYNGDGRWGAHADAELVFARPADLATVTFHFGLADGADRDETGKQRSDGVDAIVEFAPASGGPTVELFRRNLDPFHRPADLDEQVATVELPAFQKGKLIFRLTPGPSGSNAFDWGFWGRFEGEVKP